MRVQGGLELEGDLVLPTGGKIKFGAMTFQPSRLVSPAISVRTRVTLAEMNAGKTLVAGQSGIMNRIANPVVIAIGGAAAATANATGLAIYGTKSGTVTALFTCLLAALTENAACVVNTADTSIATGGALWSLCDPNTAITCRAVTAGNYDLITATHFDVIFDLMQEA